MKKLRFITYKEARKFDEFSDWNTDWYKLGDNLYKVPAEFEIQRSKLNLPTFMEYVGDDRGHLSRCFRESVNSLRIVRRGFKTYTSVFRYFSKRINSLMLKHPLAFDIYDDYYVLLQNKHYNKVDHYDYAYKNLDDAIKSGKLKRSEFTKPQVDDIQFDEEDSLVYDHLLENGFKLANYTEVATDTGDRFTDNVHVFKFIKFGLIIWVIPPYAKKHKDYKEGYPNNRYLVADVIGNWDRFTRCDLQFKKKEVLDLVNNNQLIPNLLGFSDGKQIEENL